MYGREITYTFKPVESKVLMPKYVEISIPRY